MNKITEITLNNYRAFYGENNVITVNGKNLLIYGENGSGKTAVFNALKVFFESSANPASMDFNGNIFAQEDSLTEPFVKIKFENDENDNGYVFAFDNANTTTSGNSQIVEAYKKNRFLSYKELLKTHNFDFNKFNLFDLLVENNGLISSIQNPVTTIPETKAAIGEVWELLQTDWDTYISDFESGLTRILENIETDIDSFIKDYFNLDFSVKFSTTVRYKKFNISLDISLFNERIERNHQYFLNEARLTALALSLYFASLLKNPPSDYRFLFLDDVFIGLDIANRKPLLKILKEKFSDYQLFVTTYDKYFFEIAKEYFPSSDWYSIELYVNQIEDEQQNVIREEPLIIQPSLPVRDNYLEQAELFFKAKNYPVAGNHLRKATEYFIKKLLPEGYKTAQSHDKIEEISTLDSLFNQLIKYYQDCQFDLPQDIRDSVKMYKRAVLNPLSHDDIESPLYRSEIEEMFKVAKKLRDLPKLERERILKSGTQLTFEDTSRDYQATIQLNDNLYKTSNGTDTNISKCKFSILFWICESKPFYNPKNQRIFNDYESLNNLIKDNRTIEEVYEGICKSLDIPENERKQGDDILKLFKIGTATYFDLIQ
ncbi:MAG: hypothetical protein JXL97_03500 [Bacteroidales bacterium]|nr:hypothetical protein [Bacteroidales bacterium]